MKWRLIIISTVLWAVTMVPSLATTLKLNAEVDLLVLDGRKISGSLLKGADGLELERGQHQLLFRVEKNRQPHAHIARLWRSAPLIVTFNVQAQSISIKLPLLETPQQRKAFARHPTFEMVNEHGFPVDSQRDRLSGNEINFEEAMTVYNLQSNIASVPHFAQASLPEASGNDISAEMVSTDNPTGRLLQLWYRQVDSATRQRLVRLIQALRTSDT